MFIQTIDVPFILDEKTCEGGKAYATYFCFHIFAAIFWIARLTYYEFERYVTAFKVIHKNYSINT
jgi:hypothetical protein